MTNFKFHTIESAPEQSKPYLEKSLKANGMIPGLHAIMAESPGLLKTYQTAHEQFVNSSFDKDELTVVWQTINVENNCQYCVPAHTGIAKSMGVDDSITNALRDRTPLPNDRLEVLRDFTLSVVRDRGFVEEDKVNAFLKAGFTQQNILEVILGYAQKIMSNYTNHFAKTPVDERFQKFEWHK